MDVKEGSWFDIPLGALQSDNIGNLYAAGRMISADEAAFAAVRVMGTCFATGHIRPEWQPLYRQNTAKQI